MTTARGRRFLRWTGGLLVVAGLLVVYFVGTALLARQELVRAEADLGRLRNALTSGDTTSAVQLDGVQRRTARAGGLLGGPLWAGAERLPRAGTSVQVLRGLVTEVDGSVREEIEELVGLAGRLSPDRIRQADGSLDLATLAAASAPLDRARTTLGTRIDRITLLPSDGLPGPLSAARTRILRQLRGTHGQVDTAWRFARVGPPMLGAEGPRRYFVGIQNNAELRGTGGNIGAYAVLVARDGKLALERSGSSRDYVQAKKPVAAPTAEFRALYGENPLLDIRDSNFSPHFPYAGELWKAHWERQAGKPVDGSIAIDAVALSYVLGAAGPVTLDDGRIVKGSDIVDYVLRRSYAEIQDDPERKGYLQNLLRVVFDRLRTAELSTADALDALGRAAGEGHLALWSSRPDEQAVLEETPLGHVLPTASSATSVVLNSVTGGKLDYYLQRDVNYTLRCQGPVVTTEVTVRLRNGAPARGLPRYVLIRSDVPPGAAPPAQNRWRLHLYAPAGTTLASVTLDGLEVGTTTARAERGHPVHTLTLAADAGRERVLIFKLRGPDVRRLDPIHQPVLRGTVAASRPIGCQD